MALEGKAERCEHRADVVRSIIVAPTQMDEPLARSMGCGLCASPSRRSSVPGLHSPTGRRLLSRWLRHLELRGAGAEPPLFINFDETSIAYAYTGGKGNVAASAARRRPVDRLSLGLRRGGASYLGLIASDVAVQRRLPRIVLGNAHKLTQKVMRALQPVRDRGLTVWKGTTAWTSQEVVKRVIRAVGKALEEDREPHPRGRQVILLMDAARSHISPSIITQARKARMHVAFVPAKLTHLLQPLNVRVFRTFKSRLRCAYNAARCGVPDGDINTVQWLGVIADVARETFGNRDWASAFDLVGITSGGERMGQSIREQLNPSGCWAEPALPTPEELAALLGPGVRPPANLLETSTPASVSGAAPSRPSVADDATHRTRLVPRGRRLGVPPQWLRR